METFKKDVIEFIKGYPKPKVYIYMIGLLLWQQNLFVILKIVT